MKKILTIIFVISSLMSKLILKTEEEIKAYGASEIEHKVYPLTQYPFGRKLYGYLHFIKEDGCSKIPNDPSLKTNEFPYFFLMEDQNCEIYLKALNAQNAKAELLIIISDQKFDNQNVDNTFLTISSKIHIPILVVNTAVGKKLKGILSKFEEFILNFETPLPNENNVNIEIFLNHQDFFMLDFLKSLTGVFSQFDQSLHVEFTIFRTGEEKIDQNLAELQLLIGCMQPDEIIAQIHNFNNCVINTNSKTSEISDCFLEDMLNPNIIEISYIIDCKTSKMKEIDEIKNSMPVLTASTIQSTIFMNNSIFLGPFDRDHFVTAICSNFEITPPNCIYKNNKYIVTHDVVKEKENIVKEKQKILLIINIVVLVFLLIFAALLLFLIFRKIYQNKLKEKVELVVKKSVEDYYAKIKV